MEANAMDEISKKDLLAETGISYGQLYRWKREGLIPEEWFVKRSAFTGQETFFPRERMLARVRAILALKDDLSLDQIRERLEETLLRCNVRLALLAVTDGDEDFVNALRQPTRYPELPLTTLAAALGVCEWLSRNKTLRAERLRLVDEALELSSAFLDGCSPGDRFPVAVTLFEAGGAYHLCLSGGAEPLRFDSGVTALAHLKSADIVERHRFRIPELLPDGVG
jgi:DNA-binding transcriptional MerR regulator